MTSEFTSRGAIRKESSLSGELSTLLGRGTPHPTRVRKYFGIKKKRRSIFYCATLTLVNPRLAELGFPGKPQARVQMSGTGLHPAFRPA